MRIVVKDRHVLVRINGENVLNTTPSTTWTKATSSSGARARNVDGVQTGPPEKRFNEQFFASHYVVNLQCSGWPCVSQGPERSPSGIQVVQGPKFDARCSSLSI